MSQKGILVWIAAGIMLLTGGCASTELEQRSFPLAFGADRKPIEQEEETELLVVSFDFPDLKQISEKSKTADTPMGLSLEGKDLYHVEKSYENNTNRMLDYNHLKAVIAGETLISNPWQMCDLLKSWEQENVGRNISFFIGSPGAAKIMSLTQETEGSVGKYLEEMEESQQDFKQEKIVTTGDLINQWHNQNELLLVPMLTEAGKRPVISGYGMISDFKYKGMMSVKEAMESFLCTNLLKRFTWEFTTGEVVEITGIQVEKKIEQVEGLPVITLNIKGKGRLKTGNPWSLEEKLGLEQRLEEQLSFSLEETGKTMQELYGIDITNSYISLGGYHRGLYEKYNGFPETYAKELHQVFKTEITFLNWE
ncbi:MAG: Ger(x)C family spore germination C-terminal domain-containing protein [Lachnospiraceae bacterium]